jgi:hypothetical protein
MSNGCWRGLVGLVKPARGSGSLEELIRMLPEGIGITPLLNSSRLAPIFTCYLRFAICYL